MKNDIFLIGEIGWEVTLQNVIDKVAQSDPEKPLTVHIHSGGGGVYDGLAIYNYLKGLDQEVHTASSGLVASIASVIFLAGKRETRTINSNDSFLIHLPSGGNMGNAEDLEKTAETLRDIEDKMSDIYANETDLTKEEALIQMKEDRMIDVEWLKEKGFVAEIIEFKAVARFGNNQNNQNNKNMSDVVTKTWLEEKLDKWFSPKDEPTAKIIQDATGVEIDFTELESDGTPKVGDVAEVDGKPAEGDFTLENGDVYKFEAGKLTEIVEEEDDDDDEMAEENANLKKQIEDLQAEKATIESELLDAKTDLSEIKGKIETSFEWDSKGNLKPIEKPATDRTFIPKNQK